MYFACTCMLPVHVFHQHVYATCSCVFAPLVYLPSSAAKGLEKTSFQLETDKLVRDCQIGWRLSKAAVACRQL